MKIAKINVYNVSLPRKKSSFICKSKKTPAVLHTVVVELVSDSGLCGAGEVCTPAPPDGRYLVDEILSSLKLICPKLIGLNPVETRRVTETMDACLQGHQEVKAAIDIACWDLFGKTCGQAVISLLGGQCGEAIDSWCPLTGEEPISLIEQIKSAELTGFRHFSVNMTATSNNTTKVISLLTRLQEVVGKEGLLQINVRGSWLRGHAVQVCRAIPQTNVILRQPCRTYVECLTVRSHVDLSMMLDYTVIHDVTDIVRMYGDHAADAVVLDIIRLGGLTKARLFRDLCVSLGYQILFDTDWGGVITQTSVIHLAMSTPPKHRLPITDFCDKLEFQLAEGGFQRDYEQLSLLPLMAGFGVTLLEKIIGKPVMSFM